MELKLSSVGYVMPFAHAKVVDRQGKTLCIGERGELCIAGYQLQRGYWKNEEKTREVMIRDDQGVLWLHTGDEAVINKDKTCTITGRFKDIIIRGQFSTMSCRRFWFESSTDFYRWREHLPLRNRGQVGAA